MPHSEKPPRPGQLLPKKPKRSAVKIVSMLIYRSRLSSIFRPTSAITKFSPCQPTNTSLLLTP